jgi:hypothetical protein
MRNNIIFTTVVLIFSFFLINIEIAYCSEQNICQLLPDHLLKIARFKDKGLEQVHDFYKNRPGMLNPPYVYGIVSELKEEYSMAFWCQKSKNEKRKFYLVIVQPNIDQKTGKCPDIIEWRNFPGGLSVYKNLDTTLDHFRYVKNPKKRGPKNVKLEHYGILSEYDGLSALFYCYKGQWLVRKRH